jgi:hypothetical protein
MSQINRKPSLEELLDELHKNLALLAELKAGKIGPYMDNPNIEASHESFRRLDGFR